MTETQSVSPWYLDKAVYAVVFNMLTTVMLQLFHVNLDPVALGSIALSVVTFIVMHKWKSRAIVVAEIQANARAVVATIPATPAGTADALTKL